MKVIIAGSRSISNYEIVCKTIEESTFELSEVVSGGAQGIDLLGERYAKEHSKPIKQFIPDWDKYGKSAGPRRNELMALYSEALIYIYDGKSKGTKNMIELAKRYKLKTYGIILT